MLVLPTRRLTVGRSGLRLYHSRMRRSVSNLGRRSGRPLHRPILLLPWRRRRLLPVGAFVRGRRRLLHVLAFVRGPRRLLHVRPLVREFRRRSIVVAPAAWPLAVPAATDVVHIAATV